MKASGTFPLLWHQEKCESSESREICGDDTRCFHAWKIGSSDASAFCT